jgi:hypothetical protein
MNPRASHPAGQSGRAASRFERLFQPAIADTSPVAPADDPAVELFRRLVDSRRRRDVRATVGLQRLLRDVHGYCVSLSAPRGGGRR